MELELTQGKTTVIDDEDYELASRYSWFPRTDKKSGTVYVATKIKVAGKRKWIYLHRIVMEAKKGQVVDHINRDGLDNRKENLKLYGSHSDHMKGNKNHARGGRYKYKKPVPIEYYI